MVNSFLHEHKHSIDSQSHGNNISVARLSIFIVGPSNEILWWHSIISRMKYILLAIAHVNVNKKISRSNCYPLIITSSFHILLFNIKGIPNNNNEYFSFNNQIYIEIYI